MKQHPEPAPKKNEQVATDSRRAVIRFVTEADAAAVKALYVDAGWCGPDDSAAYIPGMIKGSFCFAAAYLDGRLIGMGRAVSDGCSDAYIQDVTVLRAYRRQGLGRRLVEAIVARLQIAGVDWIGLVGEPDTGGFYEKIGFTRMPYFIPMRFTGKQFPS